LTPAACGIPVDAEVHRPSDRWGFDGQFYAELALDPLLRDPQLKIALDAPAYRSRRILTSWLAWLGGFGRPFWILNVYAGLNLVFWTGFAVMMARLFPSLRLGWTRRFCAMLITCGIIESLRSSLTDFPGFVLVTLSMMIGRAGGAGVLALAALTRDPICSASSDSGTIAHPGGRPSSGMCSMA